MQAFNLRLQKETPTQVCSCEYCDNFKNIYLEERLRAAASALEVSLFVLYRGVVRFYSLGQKIKDKFTNLDKIGFSMECFTTNFSRLYSPNVKICLLSGLVFLEISEFPKTQMFCPRLQSKIYDGGFFAEIVQKK